MFSYEHGFREIIPDQTLPEKWKEITLNTGGTQVTLQDIKVPERAGGYFYIDTLDPATRNRFIYWRISQDVLELVEHSLDIDLTGNHVRFRFHDTPILDGVSVQEMYSHVMVLVPTVSSVHRLVFPHPQKIHGRLQGLSRNHPHPSIFTDASLQSVAQQYVINHTSPNAPLPHTAASYLGLNEDAVFALSYSTGTTLLIRMDYLSGMIATTELKETSMMNRLLSGFVGGQLLRSRPSEESVPTSMVLHAVGLVTYLFTLGHDNKLRMWACERAECLLAIDVPATTTEISSQLILGHQNHMLRKATGKDDNDLYLCAFLSFVQRCMFIVLKPVIEQGQFNIERLYTAYDNRGGDLIDFWLSSNQIWALWSDAQGETVIKHRKLDRLQAPGRSDWLQVKQESPPDRTFDPCHSNEDPRRAYLEYIFHPGMFPLAIINKALTIYRRSSVGGAPTLLPEVAASVLRERVAMAVETEINTESQDLDISSEEYHDIAWRCWNRFYSCCIQYYWVGTRPIAFLAGPSANMSVGPLRGCPLGLVRKSQYSLFRPVEELEHLFEIGTQDCIINYPPGMLMDRPIVDDAMVRLLSALKMLENRLLPDAKLLISREIHELGNLEKIVDKIIEDHTVEHKLNLTSRNFLDDVFTHINENVILYAAERLVRLFDLECNPGMSMDLDADDVPPNILASISYMFSSQLGINIIAESLHQTINTRLNILRDMLVLLKLCLKYFFAIFQPRDDNHTVMEKIRSDLLPRVINLVKGYHVMHWMGQVPCGPVTPTMLEASMQQLAVLSMVDRCTLGTREMARYTQQQSQRTVTLLSLFLSSRYAQYAHNLLAQRRLDEDDISQWHTTMLPYLTILGKLIWPLSSLFVFPEFLLSSCQYLLTQEFVRLLNTWCESNLFSRMFLLGSVLLDMGESNKACDCLLRAVCGVQNEEFLNSRLGQYNHDGPEPTEEQREILYYLKIMKMFEQADQSDCVIRIVDEALRTIDLADPETATMHSAKFCHLLRLGRHKTAYVALVNNPDQLRRRDSLRQLINSMVEAGKIEMLVELEMHHDMRQDMESILLDKARSHDLLHSQYYTILHALHINRLDMRGGARIMYEQAFRLSQEVTGPVSLERQARSLLACINELSMATVRFRWLLKPRINLISGTILPMDAPNASPKRDYDGEEVKRGPKNIPVEIVELEDIRKEYQVVLAKIQLLGQNSSKKICSEVSRLSVHQLLGALCNAGRFDLALRLASLHSLPKSPILEAVVASCVCITRNEGLPPNSINWLAINDTKDLCKVDVQTSKLAWKYLQRCLELHEEKGSTELHRAIVTVLIHLKAFIPQWLTDTYKRRNIGELLRLLLAAGRLEEAARLGCDLYRAGMGLGHEDFDMTGLRQVPACVWMPHNILDWAIAELEAAVQAGEDIVYHELLLQMQDLRDQYLAQAQEVSQELRIKTTRNVNISQQTIQL